MDSYKCEPMTPPCNDTGWWINGKYYCKNHYQVTIKAKQSDLTGTDDDFRPCGITQSVVTEALASVAMDQGEGRTHFVGDDCPGGHAGEL